MWPPRHPEFGTKHFMHFNFVIWQKFLHCSTYTASVAGSQCQVCYRMVLPTMASPPCPGSVSWSSWRTGAGTDWGSRWSVTCADMRERLRCDPQPNYLCGQELAPWDCVADPGRCQQTGNTNMYGYPAHFDLQNAKLQVSLNSGVWITPFSSIRWQRD